MGVIGGGQGAFLGAARNPNWPALSVQVDFINPGAGTTTTWTDITQYVRRLGPGNLAHIERGRNYERSQTDSGTCTFVLDNSDGTFDASNTGSPFYPNVKPIRKFRVQATWAGKTYNLFYGFVEDWPRTWEKAGFRGEISATARGVFSSLSNVNLNCLWVGAAIADGAQAIYRLNDPSGSVLAANSSSFQQNFATIVATSGMNPSSQFRFGGKSGVGNLAGDPTSSLDIAPAVNSSGLYNQGTYYLKTASSADSSSGLLLNLSRNWTWECWFMADNNAAGSSRGNQIFYQQDANGSVQIDLQVQNSSTSSTAPGLVTFNTRTVNQAMVSSSNINYWDNQWHHVALTCSVSGANTTLTLYVDGAAVSGFGATASYTGSTSVMQTTPPATQQMGWGAGINPWAGSLKNAAWYPGTILTATQIQNHFNAGAGYPNEDSGARIGRLLALAPYTNTVVDTGNSLLGPANVEGKNVVQAIQEANDTETGTLVERGDGAVVFKNRQSRGSTAPLAVFGESGVPYENGIQFLQDPREIYTTVKVNRNFGINITNTDTAATLDYFPRTMTISSFDATDLQAIYLSGYQLARYKVARDRIPNLKIKPSANPSLWPQALGREIGDRITVTKQGHAAVPMYDDYSTTPFGGTPRVTSLAGTWSWDSTTQRLIETDSSNAYYFAVESSYTRTVGLDVAADFTLLSDPSGLAHFGLFLQSVDGSAVTGYRVGYQSGRINVYYYTAGVAGSAIVNNAVDWPNMGSTHNIRVTISPAGAGVVYLDGVNVGTWTDTTANTLRPGYFCYGNTLAVDNLRAQIFGGTTGISEDFYIDKITHDISVGQWETTYMLSSASLYDAWILGDPTYGVLNKTTVVGF